MTFGFVFEVVTAEYKLLFNKLSFVWIGIDLIWISLYESSLYIVDDSSVLFTKLVNLIFFKNFSYIFWFINFTFWEIV